MLGKMKRWRGFGASENVYAGRIHCLDANEAVGMLVHLHLCRVGARCGWAGSVGEIRVPVQRFLGVGGSAVAGSVEHGCGGCWFGVAFANAAVAAFEPGAH